MFLLIKICLIFGWNVSAQYRVVIDPGHGARDQGAIGPENTIEKNIVLRIAEEIVLLNRSLFDNTIEIYLTRYQDTLILLKERARLTKALNANVFISLHCNHSVNPNAKGIEVYVTKEKLEHSRTSTWLAYELQQQFKEKLGYKSRGVKFANFQVLLETAGSMPSVLVELGYLSNKDENNHIQKPKSYRALSLVILESLIENLDSYARARD